MLFEESKLAQFRTACGLLAYSPACTPLADALAACWPHPHFPLAVPLDGTMHASGAWTGHASGWTLFVTAEDIEPAVLDFNRWLVKRRMRSLLVLDRPDGLWALWRSDTGIAPCLICLDGQRELMPKRVSRAPSPSEKAHALANWIDTHLATCREGFLYPILATPDVRFSQVLQDPRCSHCSVHATRPNHVFFTADS